MKVLSHSRQLPPPGGRGLSLVGGDLGPVRLAWITFWLIHKSLAYLSPPSSIKLQALSAFQGWLERAEVVEVTGWHTAGTQTAVGPARGPGLPPPHQPAWLPWHPQACALLSLPDPTLAGLSPFESAGGDRVTPIAFRILVLTQPRMASAWGPRMQRARAELSWSLRSVEMRLNSVWNQGQSVPGSGLSLQKG